MTESSKAAVPTSWQSVVLSIALAAIAAVPPTLLAWAAYNQSLEASKQSIKTHELVNSRMDEFKTLVIKSTGDAATLKEKDRAATEKAVVDAAVTAEKAKAMADSVLPPKK